MFVPNAKGIYGSQFTVLHPKGGFEKGKSYFYKVELTKYHLIGLDQPSEPCVSKRIELTTSSCITKFVETKLGCTPRIYGIDTSTKKDHYCNSPHHLESLANISQQFIKANGNDLYKLTGCLGSCERDEYERIIAPHMMIHESYGTNLSDVHLKFSFGDGSYEVKEQYLLYDYDSFIADVGGFMGLLLGCSVFSLYQELADMVVRSTNCLSSRRPLRI